MWNGVHSVSRTPWSFAIVMVLGFMIGIVQAWEPIGGPSIGITQEVTALVRGRERNADDSVEEKSRP
jgi:hypothetical protein